MMRARASALTPEAGFWRDPADFFSQGRVGAWRSAFTDAELERYQERAVELFPDERFLRWVHVGSTGTAWRARTT